MENITENNTPEQNMPAVGQNSNLSKNPTPWIVLAVVIIVAAAGYWWWQTTNEANAPELMVSPSPMPAFDQDTQGDIEEIEAVTTSDLDAEFQSIDQGINEL